MIFECLSREPREFLDDDARELGLLVIGAKERLEELHRAFHEAASVLSFERPLQEFAHALAPDFLQQRMLGFRVMEHRSHPHSGVPGDVPDRRLIEPEARKVLPRGLENPLSFQRFIAAAQATASRPP